MAPAGKNKEQSAENPEAQGLNTEVACHMSILNTSFLNSVSDRLAISSLASSIFGALISLFILWHLLHSKGQILGYLPVARAGQHTLLRYGTVCRGGDQERTMSFACLSGGFQSLPQLSTIKLGHSGADSQASWFAYILEPCESLQWTHLWGWEFLPPTLQPFQVFTVRDFEALFSHSGTLGYTVSLIPQLFLLVYLHSNVGSPSPQATALSCVFFTSAARVHPSYPSGWIFL